MHKRRTMRLDQTQWDILLDETGRIALAENEEATAQNVANEVRLFTEDAYFTQDKGIPHFLTDIGTRIHSSLLRSYLRKVALQDPNVKEVIAVTLTNFDPKTRTITGDIQFTTVEGTNNGTIRTYF